jgi:hypothetical protein
MRIAFTKELIGFVILLGIATGAIVADDLPPQTPAKATETTKREPITVRMTVYPALPPTVVMKHRLLPGYLDKIDGNAAIQYLKGGLSESLGTRLQERQEQIGDLLDGELKDFDAEKAGTVLAEIGDNTFEYLRLASRRRDVDWGMPFQEHRIYEILIPEVQQMRQYGYYLALRARLQIAEGKIDDAIATLRVGYSLARHIAEGPTLINGLVGVAIGAMMNQQLRELQARPEMENLYWTLAALPDPLIDLRTAMEVEADGVFVMFPQLKDVATADLTPEQWNARLWEFMRSLSSLTPLLSEGDTQDWKGKLMEGVGAAMIVTTFLPKAKSDLEAMGWSKERLATMAPAQVVLLHVSEVYQELRDATFKWFHVPYWKAQTPDEEKEILAGGKLRNEIIPLARLLMPAVNAARFAAMRSSRDMAAMQTVEALRAYAAEHDGKLPAKLEDITKYPVPLDPTRGALFDYRVDGKTFTLESPAPPSRQKSDGLRYIVTLAERTKDMPKAGERLEKTRSTSKYDKPVQPATAEKEPGAKEKQTGATKDTSKVAGGIVRALSKNPIAEALESSRRTKSINNMRQLALALHNYHDSYKALPPPVILSKDGKPLLSWRVAILPYVEAQELYDKFHLNEPWDSEHNKKLIAEMPDVFRSPSAKPIPMGKTVYLLPRGDGTMFEGAQGVRFSAVKDGISTTIMIVEAKADQAVEWTKPDDINVDLADPFRNILGLRGDVFLAAFGDASVRTLSRHMDKENLKAMFTPAGGERVK